MSLRADVGRKVHRRDHRALRIAQRNRDRPQTLFELLVHQRKLLAADLGQRLLEPGTTGNRVSGGGLQIDRRR